jgi:hypothetical protein
VSFQRAIGVDPRVGVLAANELEVLADESLELADRYARAAPFMEDEEGRQIALTLSNWRRTRGQYFRELSAEAERTEAEHLELEEPRLTFTLSLLSEADCTSGEA